MPQSFSAKLDLLLKALSLNRGDLVTALGVDKSLVGRWARGAVKPSAHNLARLTALVESRVEGFTALDWERDLESLATLVGVDPKTATGRGSLTIREPIVDLVLRQAIEGADRRAGAYEGFFRSTRPSAQMIGRFICDHLMIRRDPGGLLRVKLGSAGVTVEGWVLQQQHQMFMVAAESSTSAMAFGIFNGVNTLRADFVEGLLLFCAFDMGRTPTACMMVMERIGELSGDVEADNARFADLARIAPLAAEGSVPEEVRTHLARDFGPKEAALGGDWVLRLPIARALTVGDSLTPSRAPNSSV